MAQRPAPRRGQCCVAPVTRITRPAKSSGRNVILCCVHQQFRYLSKYAACAPLRTAPSSVADTARPHDHQPAPAGHGPCAAAQAEPASQLKVARRSAITWPSAWALQAGKALVPGRGGWLSNSAADQDLMRPRPADHQRQPAGVAGAALAVKHPLAPGASTSPSQGCGSASGRCARKYTVYIG